MTAVLQPLPSPYNPKRAPDPRRRTAIMLGASALGHLALFGWMIWQAAGEDLVLPEWTQLPIIQLELIPPLLPRPRPEPVPVPVEVKPQPVTKTDVEAEPQPLEQPTPPPVPQEQSLEQLTPQTPPSPLNQSLPSVMAVTPQEEAEVTPPNALTAPSQIITSVPSLRPEPQPSAEALSRAPSLTPPTPINRSLPSVTSPTTSAHPNEGEAVDTRAEDELIRRRKAEEEAAMAAGAPSAPIPRLASPVPGAPAPGAGQTSPVPGISEAWRVAPSSQGSRNARALRSSPLGCTARERLTLSEQALCDERFNADAAEGARNPIQGSGNAARDARFARESARERYNYEARRAPLSGGTGNVTGADCPGSNFGTGCAGSLIDPSLQMDSTSNIRTNKLNGRRAPGAPQTPGSAGSTARPGNGADD